MIPSKVLEEARYLLSDTEKERWEDSHLLALFNACVREIAVQHKLFKAVDSVSSLQCGFEIPACAISLNRVEDWSDSADYKGCRIPIISEGTMDDINPQWQTEVSTKPLEYVIYTHERGNRQYAVYPLNPRELTIYYNLVPADVTTNDLIDDITDLPVQYSNAIIYYIAGRAIRDNMDTQNRQFGVELLQQYAGEMSVISKNLMLAGNGGANRYNTGYNPMGG